MLADLARLRPSAQGSSRAAEENAASPHRAIAVGRVLPR